MSYVLGLDLGTGSMKGLLYTKTGELIFSHSEAYPVTSEKKGYSEQAPKDWIQACEEIITKMIEIVPDSKQQLEGISFSGQMHSLVLTNEEDRVVRPAILWNDVRTTKQCDEIKERLGDTLLKVTKNKALEGFTLPKILWVQENEPENWQKTRHIMMPKDYLGFYLTGVYYTDYSDAAGTLLLNIKNRSWSSEILEEFDIPSSYMPKLYESSGQVGQLTPGLKEKFGFETDIKVFAGGADNPCSALGSGLVSSETAMVSLGTSGVVLTKEDDEDVNYEGTLHVFNDVMSDQLYSMGVTLSAGNSLHWYKNTFAPEQSYDELLTKAAQIELGSGGLLFTPYINGERTPHTDSQIRGSFIGLDNQHTLDHLTRAVIEGITFSLQDCLSLVEENKEIKEIISVGGGSRSELWRQIQADIFNAQVITIESQEGPGTGAAMLAALGLGWYHSVEDCVEKFVSYSEPISPVPENVKLYNEIYKVYQDVYQNTRDITARLHQIDKI